MKYTKVIVCGGKEIEISDDTKVTLRFASDNEKIQFAKTHWNLPKEFSCQSDMWESLCEMLNNLKYIGFFDNSPKIWKKCLEALKMECPGSLRECHFKFIPESNTYIKNKIEITLTYENKEETIYTTVTKTKICDYPRDFEILLRTIEKYLAEEMDLSEMDLSEMLSELNNEPVNIVRIPGKPLIMSLNYADKIFSSKRIWEQKPKKYKNHLELLSFIDSNLSEIKNFYKYASAYSKISESEQRVLDVDGEIFFEFENDCGFNIEEKAAELQLIIKKVSKSNDPGESEIEFCLNYFKDNYNRYIASIKKDCESDYSYTCILLRNPNPHSVVKVREYDHILVCSAGIVIIETKNWNGIVEIRPDGQWIRKNDAKPPKGAKSPASQMKEQEDLMRKIIPTVPIHSLLCFSHPNVIIDGRENFKKYPIIKPDQLEDTLSNLCMDKTYSRKDIDEIAATIEAHKVRTV